MKWGRLGVLLGSTAAHVGAVGLAVLAVGAGAVSVIEVDLRGEWIAGRPEEPDAPPRRAEPAPVRAAPGRSALAREVALPSPAPPLPAAPAVSPPPGPIAPAAPGPAAVVKAEAPVAASPEPALEAAPPAPTIGPGPGVAPAQLAAEAPSRRAAGGGSPPDTETRGPGGAVSPGPPADARGGSGAGASGPLAVAIPGDGGGNLPAEYGGYYARFRKHVQEALVYPRSARRRGLMGSVEIEVVIDPAGAVSSARVVASSSHAVLDEAALQAIRSLAPLPLPEHLPRRSLRVRLPLTFVLE